MANRHRGEIDATFDGVSHKLCLTLGALAELEAAFGDADMLALAQRFEGGRLKANDAVRIIGAGLRGGGHEIGDDKVAALKADGGAAGFVAIVAQLLQATFGAAESPAPDRRLGQAPLRDPTTSPHPAGSASAEPDAAAKKRPSPEGAAPAPFPGTR